MTCDTILRSCATLFIFFAISTQSIIGQGPVIEVQPGDLDPSASLSQRNRRIGNGGRWVASLPPVPEAPLSVRLTEVATGRLLRTVTDLEGKVIGIIEADPAKDRLAISLEGGVVAMMDASSSKQMWRTAPPAVPKNGTVAVCDLRMSPDGSRLQGMISVMPPARFRMPKAELTYYVWDANTGTTLESRKWIAEEGYNSVKFSDDGAWLAGTRVSSVRSSSVSLKTVIWDVATGKQVGLELNGSVGAMSKRAHRALVSTMQPPSMTTALINTDTGKPIACDLPANVTGGAFSPDGKKLVVGGAYAGFGWRIIDPVDCKVGFAGDKSQPVAQHFIFFPDGAHLLAGDFIVDLSDPAHYRRMNDVGDKTPAEPLVRAGDFTTSMTNAEQAAFRARVLERAKDLDGPVLGTPSASFSSDGRWLIVRAADAQLDFFDVRSGAPVPFRVPTNIGGGKAQPPLSTAVHGRFIYVRTATVREKNKVNVAVETPRILFSGKKTQVVESTAYQEAFSTDVIDTVVGKKVRTTEFKGVHCISGGGEFAVEFATTEKGAGLATLKSANGEVVADLIALGLDLSAGCSVSHSGKYVVVAGANPKMANQTGRKLNPLAGMPYGARFGTSKGTPVIYDIGARKVVASLQDGADKSGRFPFGVSDIKWTAGDRFLFAGGSNLYYSKHGPVRVFDAATGAQLHALPESEQTLPLELSADGATIVTRIANTKPNLMAGNIPMGSGLGVDFGVDVRDADSGRILYSLPDASAEPGGLAFSPNGKSIVGPSRDGAISIWSRTNGILLGQLRALQAGEWLVYSPSGPFDGSRRAWSRITWRESEKQLGLAEPEIYFNEFYNPGLLADFLEGRSVKSSRSVSEIDRRQPMVALTAKANGDGTATIRLSAAEAPGDSSTPKGSGVRDLRLFRNGQLIRAWRGEMKLDNGGSASLEVKVPVTPGDNRFTAYAFNAANIKSKDGSDTLRVPGTPKLGVAHILAIGINEYANPNFNLKFAVSDAQAIVGEWSNRQKELAQFSSIESVVLSDKNATRANILLALKRLSGDQSGALPPTVPEVLRGLRPIKPEDTLVLYFAGHGLGLGDRFYLIPHDLGYSGDRDAVRSNIATIAQHGISDQDLERLLEPIDARHITLIIDACQSGQALSSDDDRQGPMNSRGLAQLAWEKGISILVASQAYQVAIEDSELGHGFLTYALTEEGSRSPVADTSPADRLISEVEWFEYATNRVPQLQIRAMEKKAEENRLLVPDSPDPMRLQTPRLFTPRDLSGAPFIVAKVK